MLIFFFFFSKAKPEKTTNCSAFVLFLAFCKAGSHESKTTDRPRDVPGTHGQQPQGRLEHPCTAGGQQGPPLLPGAAPLPRDPYEPP